MTKNKEQYDPNESYTSAEDMPWEGAAATSETYDFGNGIQMETRVLRVGGTFGRRVMDFRRANGFNDEPIEGEVVNDEEKENE